MSESINIAVIDDHRIFLEGVSILVGGMNSAFTVGGFESPSDFLRKLEAHSSYDLVICDLIMNSMNGLAFIAAIRSHRKHLPVLVLSGINTAAPITEIKRLGGNGFVHKSSGNETLLEAIRTVLSGKIYFAEDGNQEQVCYPSKDFQMQGVDRSMTPILPKLGPRQIEVLRLIAEGATNKDVSMALAISENTVKTHLKQIFIELGVNKRTACVRKAQTLGLI